MNVTTKKDEETDVRYLKIDAVVYFWEDGIVNGVSDVAMTDRHTGIIDRAPAIPFAVKIRDRQDNAIRVDDYHWQPVIDLETGIIVGWPLGTVAKVNYKVRDEGTYTLLSDDGKAIVRFRSYVPACLGDKFNDYICMGIDANGKIANFHFTISDAKDMINGNLPAYTGLPIS